MNAPQHQSQNQTQLQAKLQPDTILPAEIAPPAPRPLQPDGRVHGVVVACRRTDGRLLCIRRSARVIAPLKVCFPGGAVEVGESQHEAVIREMAEEVGGSVRPLDCHWVWQKPDSNLTLFGWTAELLAHSLRPDPAEVAEILWLSPSEIAAHPDGLPSNPLFVSTLPK